MAPKKAASRCGTKKTKAVEETKDLKKTKMAMVVTHSSPEEGPSESAPVEGIEPEVSPGASPVASPVASVLDGEYKLYFFFNF